jgi:glycosyltransferase involved in cell wall biosynthesis
LISFIVPAYNEEELLGQTLDALHHAAAEVSESYEIIVVDDNSLDRTREVAKAQGAKVIPVKNRQIAATRNAGAREARGDYFIFVDADTIISSELLEETMDAFQSGAVGGGASFTFDDPVPRYARRVERMFYRLCHWGVMVSGAYMFCTREAYEQTGGYDERLYAAEEWWMFLALRKIGPFRMLTAKTITSGRKIRQYSHWKVIKVFLKILVSGLKIRDRESADVWYDSGRGNSGEE